MRLHQYLNEDGFVSREEKDAFVQLIKKDCKPFLREFTAPVYRGMNLHDDESRFGKRSPRTDRRPLDTSKSRHDMFDDGFEAVFGWRARTVGLFCTMDQHQAWAFRNNGAVYLVFPIGEYKYLWSNSIHDLYDSKELILGNDFGKAPDPEYIKKSIKLYYEDKNVPMTNKNEIMFKCKEYYYVHENFLYVDHYKELGLKMTKLAPQPSRDEEGW